MCTSTHDLNDLKTPIPKKVLPGGLGRDTRALEVEGSFNSDRVAIDEDVASCK